MSRGTLWMGDVSSHFRSHFRRRARSLFLDSRSTGEGMPSYDG
ncbi:unnamed protein product [Ixodes pacificus]